MGKRQYDRMKHSGRKNKHDLAKNAEKGGKGWGSAMEDYRQDWGVEEQEYTQPEQPVLLKEDYYSPQEPAAPQKVPEQKIALMLKDNGPFKKDDCVGLFEYTQEEGEFNLHFRNVGGDEFWMLAKGDGVEFVWYDPEKKEKVEAPTFRVIPIRQPVQKTKRVAVPAPEPSEPGVDSWSVEEVKTWITTFGDNFTTIAQQFAECQVDGVTLCEITCEDLQETCGKGLLTRRLWIEIKKLTGNED